MMDTFKKGLALGLGLAATSVEHAERVIDDLVKKGEMTKEESKAFFNEYYKKGQDTHRNILGELNVATKDDINRLQARLDKLEAQINQEQ
ncbi:phasin family protein [Amphibacillus cookii]|uniref:phasin family protein n=1 Tax=Amphibacillus cookii TaxID=767787 RepID=UPI00195D89AE|nr:hypothetical protein [Amphibacillus cookii]MBM7542339.1 polyhydroxyalkanoate synthesis regulator phasin [Amphibacillus cookii]